MRLLFRSPNNDSNGSIKQKYHEEQHYKFKNEFYNMKNYFKISLIANGILLVCGIIEHFLRH